MTFDELPLHLPTELALRSHLRDASWSLFGPVDPAFEPCLGAFSLRSDAIS